MGKLIKYTIVAFLVTVPFLAQVPTLSYSGTQYFVVGTSITPLIPVTPKGAFPSLYYGQVSTLAGKGTEGDINGTGTAAAFRYPSGIVADANGNIYVSDSMNHKIKKITSSGVVTTFAGSGLIGATDGTGILASFNYPLELAIDTSGNIYVADLYNNKIRKITPSGVVSTLAGSGAMGATDGVASSATFNQPIGLAVDAIGNVYVADSRNNKIRKINPSGLVSTFAGSGAAGSNDAKSTLATFNSPHGLAIDFLGNVYVADSSNNKIRKISPDGTVVTFAGNGMMQAADDVATYASFNYPTGIAIDPSGNVYVSDQFNHQIRKISPIGLVSTLSGSGLPGLIDEVGTLARFKYPSRLTVDALGNIYVSDYINHVIRKISLGSYSIAPHLSLGLQMDTATGVISGTPILPSEGSYVVTASNDYGKSTATLPISIKALELPAISYPAPLEFPINKTIDPLTPVNTGGFIPPVPYGKVDTFAGIGIPGSAIGESNISRFNTPNDILIDVSGNFYVADTSNNRIRKISPMGQVSTFAGSGSPDSRDGVSAIAGFNNPKGIAVDGFGNMYVCDSNNNKIRKISMAGIVSTFAGSGAVGLVNGNRTSALFNNPRGIVVDYYGNLYVADSFNNCIRKIDAAGEVSTFAGSGIAGSNDGITSSAGFNMPTALAIDALGNIYVADTGNNKIRKVTNSGLVKTLAGTTEAGTADGLAEIARFDAPTGIALDALGNVFVSDSKNNTIRKITSSGMVSTIAGSSISADKDGVGINAGFANPVGLVTDAMGNVYVADSGNHKIRKISQGSYSISPELPSGINFDHITGIISGSASDATAKSVYKVKAINATGQDSTEITMQFFSLPNISYSKFQTYYVGYNIIPLVPVNIGSPANYTISPALPQGLFLDPLTGIINGVPTKDSSLTTYSITAKNVAGSNIFNILIEVLSKPIIAYETPKIYAIGIAMNPLIPSNTGSFSNKYSISPTLPQGMSFDSTTGIISGTPSVATSKINYTVSATSDDGVGTFILQIEVVGKPIITYDSPQVFYVGQPITPLVPKEKGGGLITYYIFPNLPKGLSFDIYSGIISGTPQETTNVNYRVSASNVAGSNSCDLVIQIVLLKPDVAYGGFKKFVIGETIKPLIPINSGGPVTEYNITPSLPPGLSLDKITGIISGTALKECPEKGYVLTAKNEMGESNVGLVIAVMGEPVISYATPQKYTVGQEIHPLIPQNFGGPADSFSIYPPLPEGLVMDFLTGAITGVPVFSSPETVYIITGTNAAGSNYSVVFISTISMLREVQFVKSVIKVYPNPVKGILYIETPDDLPIEGLQVMDMTGKIVLEQSINLYQLDLRNLEAGVYILNFLSDKGSCILKFVKI